MADHYKILHNLPGHKRKVCIGFGVCCLTHFTIRGQKGPICVFSHICMQSVYFLLYFNVVSYVFLLIKFCIWKLPKDMTRYKWGQMPPPESKIMDPPLKKPTSPAAHITSNIQQTNIFSNYFCRGYVQTI